MLDYINEDTFENYAHYAINFHRGLIFNPEILTKNAIIFCHTNYLDVLFQQIKTSEFKYILITHGSDYPINIQRYLKKPKNVIKWFAENKDYIHPDLISIPIGLSPQYYEYQAKRITFIASNIENFPKISKNTQLLYCNWNMGNGKDRCKILNSMKLPCLWEYNLTDSDYYIHMCNFKYVVSPPGNGIDCHRTWEALYLKCIPIVLKHSLYDEFFDLPILQVNDYSELTYDLLDNFSKKEFKYEKLYMSYWKKRITDEFNKL